MFKAYNSKNIIIKHNKGVSKESIFESKNMRNIINFNIWNVNDLNL